MAKLLISELILFIIYVSIAGMIRGIKIKEYSDFRILLLVLI